MKHARWLGGLAAVLVTAAHAASFDCSKATRPVEKLICGDLKLNAADGLLGQAYRTGIGRLPPAGIGPLRADQVQWLAWMQEVCHAPGPGDALTTQPPAADVATCMLPLYEERTKQLRGIVAERNGIRFLTRTQYLAAPEEQGEPGAPEFPGFGTLQVSWPLALSDTPEWIAWNHAVEAAAFSMACGGGEARKAAAAAVPAWQPAMAEGGDSEVTVRVRRIDHGWVTSALAADTMGHGAAHPNEESKTMTWLLQAKRPVRAEDVFQPGAAWKKLVAAACWKALHNGEQSGSLYDEVTGPGAKLLQDVVADVGNWTLEHDGLHISYPEYSVAPRATPVDDTVISWTALKPVLDAGFTAP